VEQLEQADGPKGRVLQYVGTRAGEGTLDMLPAIVAASLDNLPIAKRMRWAAAKQQFVRPVHWVVMLFGSAVVNAEILGVAQWQTFAWSSLSCSPANQYRKPRKVRDALREKGYVMADVSERRELIRSAVTNAAHAVGGNAVIDPSLLDEVTALVRMASARHRFVRCTLPGTSSGGSHCNDAGSSALFPVRDASGRLMNHFVTIANIESRDPAKVRDGNERVVRPRLSDAAFFWNMDRKQRLEARCDSLKSGYIQTKLGSVFGQECPSVEPRGENCGADWRGHRDDEDALPYCWQNATS